MSPRAIIVSGLGALLGFAPAASAAMHDVHPNGSGDFAKIQDAIDAAASGDTIRLGDGTFAGMRNRDLQFLGKNLILRSASADPASCAIDCQGQSRGLSMTAGETAAVVEGITIKNGFGPWGGGVNLMNATATFRNCVITKCSADDSFGAAIAAGFYALHSTVTLEDCAFVENFFALRGTGAGLFAWNASDVTATRCRFVGNRAPGATAGGSGGGIRVQDSKLTLVDCEVLGNMAVIGAGISTGQLCIVDFRNCLIAGNSNDTAQGSQQAAGIQIGYDTDGTIESCTIVGNRAFDRGAGMSVANDCNLTISNSILWGNCVGAGLGEAAHILALGEVDFVCCDVDPAKVSGGIVTYSNSLAVDPWFCAPEPCASAPTSAGEYTLDASSPLLSAPGCGLIGRSVAACGAVGVSKGSGLGANLELRCGPNPFRESATLTYSVPTAGPVEIEVFDAAGRAIARFDEGVRESGIYTLRWDARAHSGARVSPGVYFARVRSLGKFARAWMIRV